MWAAGRHHALTTQLDTVTAALATAWATALPDLPHSARETIIAATTHYSAGLILETLFLHEAAALSPEEALRRWKWASAGLLEAAQLSFLQDNLDPDPQ